MSAIIGKRAGKRIYQSMRSDVGNMACSLVIPVVMRRYCYVQNASKSLISRLFLLSDFGARAQIGIENDTDAHAVCVCGG